MQVQPALAQSSPIDPQHLLVQHESHFPNQRLSSFQSTPASTLHGFPMQQSSLALYPLSAQQNDLALSHVTYAQASSSTTSSARHLSHSGNLAAMPATLDQQLFLAPVSEKRGAVRSINAYSNSVSQPPTLFNRPAQPSGTVIKEGRVRLRPSQKHQGVWPRVMATLDSACILRLEGRGVTRLSVWNKGTSSNVPPRRPSISDMYWSNHAELAPTEALAAPESGSSLEANEEPSHLNTSKRRMEPISPVSPRFPLALSTGLTALAPARETPSPDPIDLRGRPDRPSKAVRRSSSAGLLDSGRSHGRFDSKELRRGISVNPRRTLRKSDQSAELPISDRTQAKETNPPGLRSSSRATMSPTPYRSISTPTLQLGKYSESAFSMTFRVLAIQESTALNALRRPTRCLKVTVIPIGDDEEFAGKADESLPTSHIFIRHRLRAKMDAWKKLIKDALNSREIEIPVDDADDGSVEELDKPLQVVEESRVEDASPSPDQGMGHGNEHVAEQNGSFSRRSQISSTSSALSRRRRMSSIHRPRLVPQKVRSLAAVPSEEESIDSSSEARLKSEANEVVKVHAKLRKYQQKEAEWKRQIADLKRRLEENEEQHRKNQTELFDELQDAADENTKNAEQLESLQRELKLEKAKSAELDAEVTKWRELASKALGETMARIKAEREVERVISERDSAIGEFPTLKMQNEELIKRNIELVKENKWLQAQLDKETTARKRLEHVERTRLHQESLELGTSPDSLYRAAAQSMEPSLSTGSASSWASTVHSVEASTAGAVRGPALRTGFGTAGNVKGVGPSQLSLDVDGNNDDDGSKGVRLRPQPPTPPPAPSLAEGLGSEKAWRARAAAAAAAGVEIRKKAVAGASRVPTPTRMSPAPRVTVPSDT